MRIREYLRGNILGLVCSVLCAISGVIFIDTWAKLAVGADVFRDISVLSWLEEVLDDSEPAAVDWGIISRVLAVFFGMLIAPWCVWIVGAWHYCGKRKAGVLERCAEAVIVLMFMVMTLNDFSTGAAAIVEWRIPKEYAEEAIVSALYGKRSLIWVFVGVGMSVLRIWPIIRPILQGHYGRSRHR